MAPSLQLSPGTPADHDALGPGERAADVNRAADPWAALEGVLRDVLGATLDVADQREALCEFMAMGTYHDAAVGAVLWAYKHIVTRRYAYLTDDGRAYLYDAGGLRFVPARPADAIARARRTG